MTGPFANDATLPRLKIEDCLLAGVQHDIVERGGTAMLSSGGRWSAEPTYKRVTRRRTCNTRSLHE